MNLQDGSDSNRNEPYQRCCAGTWRDVQDGRLGDEDSRGVARLQWESSGDLDCSACGDRHMTELYKIKIDEHTINHAHVFFDVIWYCL